MNNPRTRQERKSAAQAEQQGVAVRAKRKGRGLRDDRTHPGFKPSRHECWKRHRAQQWKG